MRFDRTGIDQQRENFVFLIGFLKHMHDFKDSFSMHTSNDDGDWRFGVGISTLDRLARRVAVGRPHRGRG